MYLSKIGNTTKQNFQMLHVLFVPIHIVHADDVRQISLGTFHDSMSSQSHAFPNQVDTASTPNS